MVKRLFIAFLLMIFTLTGCSVNSNSQNVEKSYNETVTKETYSGNITPFINPEDINIKNPLDRIAITVSPTKKYIYYMEVTNPSKNKKKNAIVLKGRTEDKINIIKYDIQSGKSNTIISNIPFVSLVNWNKSGDIVGFCGNYRLTLYDEKNNKLLFGDDLKNDSITYFGWSPDGRTVYTEDPNLTNGTIYNLDNKTIVHCYQNVNDMYFKGKLNDKYYYGTTNDVIEGKATTYLLDKNRNIIMEVCPGRFRGSYKNSVVLVGKDGFGLFLISDINNPLNIKSLSNKFIYDAKFVYDGNLMYIEKNNLIEKNEFLLHIVNKDGVELLKETIHGDSVTLSFDGKSGYASGPRKEYIDFLSNTVKANNISALFDEETEKVFETVRGAMDTYMKCETNRDRDYKNLDKYFIDTDNPSQWAHFDLLSEFKERKGDSSPMEYKINILAEDFTIDFKNNRASFIVKLDISNSFGSGSGTGEVLELVKRDNQWFITGFSTFPYSKEYTKVEALVKKYVKQCKAGTLFNGQLKGKNITIEQIQFWEMSDPHHSNNIKSANYCKVYLKVKENNKDVIYKMVLNKKYQSNWKPTTLKTSDLWWLF